MQPIKFHLLFMILFLLVLYSITLPTNLTLEDDGFFVMSAWFNGVSHPPGYPLHNIISHLATLVPFSSIPARVHFVSSIFAALSAACLSLIVFQLLRSRLWAIFAGILFAGSKLFWSQAIIAEVYTLNTFLFLLLVYLGLLITEAGNDLVRKNYLYVWTAFIYGLAIANHWPLIVLGSSLLAIMYVSDWRLIIKNLPKLLLFFAFGLMPYVWMVYRSWQEPVFSFSGEIRSFSDFVYIFSRSSYASQDQSVTAGWYDKWQYLIWFSKLSLQQFLLPLSILGIIGCITSWFILSKKIALALLAGFITQSYFLILLLGFDFEPEKQSIIKVYFLPAFAIIAIWVVVGISTGVNFLSDKLKLGQAMLKFMMITLLALQLTQQFFINDRSGDRFSLEYATAVFNLLPENSILIVDDDISAGVFGYYHFVKGSRPDITIISSTGYGFNTRLFHPIGTPLKTKNQLLSELLLNSGRPVYATRSVKLFGEVPQINYGIVHQLAPELKARQNFQFSGYAYQFFQNLSQATFYNDSWEKGFREYLMMIGIQWAMVFRNDKELLKQGYDIRKLVERLNQSPKTALALYEIIVMNVKEDEFREKLPGLRKYLEKNTHMLSKHENSVLRKLNTHYNKMH